jgi:hypothetical protein
MARSGHMHTAPIIPVNVMELLARCRKAERRAIQS